MNFSKAVSNNPLQKQLADILAYGADGPRSKTSWSSFNEDDLLEEEQLVKTYFDIALKNASTPVKSVLDQAEKDVKSKDSLLVHTALSKFVIFNPHAKNQKLSIPPLVRLAPKSTLPKQKTPLAPGPLIGVPTKTPENEEDYIEYWREDTNLNNHHLHWHQVYGSNRVTDPSDSTKFLWKKRQGELFIFMHRQMVARYYAERLSVGLPEVIELADYTKPIPEPYDASDVEGYASRPKDLTLNDDFDYKPATVADLAASRDLLVKTIEQGYFDTLDGSRINTEGNLDLLGIAIEAGISERTYEKYNASVWGTTYQPFHNNGHMKIAFIDGGTVRGVIGDNATASRDPVFYRWHKYVDDLFVRYQSKLPPNDYSNNPPVSISGDDVFLIFKDKIDGIKDLAASTDRTKIEKAAQTWGESHFEHFPKHATNVLETKLKSREIDWVLTKTDTTDTAVINYLTPREWYYFFRVENKTNKAVAATFRVFIVPAAYEGQFNRYIEVDKFQKEIPPNSKTIISRDCDRAAPVAQPPKKTVDQLDDIIDPTQVEDLGDVAGTTGLTNYTQYCECGWPFNLLLPRGTPDGLPYKLVVFLSSGELDRIQVAKKCGSLSFCGSQDIDGDYPDKKEMGYPFNRPLKNGSLKDTFRNFKNVAVKDIKIRHVADFPEFTPSASTSTS